MKKVLSFALVLIMAMVLFAGCEFPAENGDVNDNIVEETPGGEEPASEESEPEEPEQMGTRSNPFPLNATAIYDGMEITQSFRSYFAFKAELTATEVIRGDEASAMFDNDPEEGKEFFLVKFRVKVLDTVFDEVVRMNNARFDLVSKDGVQYGDLVSATGIKTLDDIFAGGETEGFIFAIINAGDEPLIVFAQARDGGIWFDVNE